jgi:hypothetical protein
VVFVAARPPSAARGTLALIDDSGDVLGQDLLPDLRLNLGEFLRRVDGPAT